MPLRKVQLDTATSHDQLEAKGTAHAIEDMAAQFSRPLSEVREILSIHIYRLDQQARIKQYVSLLAIRQVKELLRIKQRTNPWHLPTPEKPELLLRAEFCSSRLLN